MVNRTARLAILVGLLLALQVTAHLVAQEAKQAALVISLGDGEVITRCVQFAEDQISGYELLVRSGLALEIDLVGLGSTVCKIEATGCAAGDCFCECTGGGACLYWSYWHQRDGVWSYSNVGADVFQVSSGDVEGWVWGAGSPNEAPAPPDLAYEDVCTTMVDMSEGESDRPLAGNDRAGVDTTLASPDAPEQRPESGTGVAVGDGDRPWSPYALAALLVIGLVVLLAVRRGRGVQ